MGEFVITKWAEDYQKRRAYFQAMKERSTGEKIFVNASKTSLYKKGTCI
jgi:hypothetical protein